ncbi:MAG TPA: hypothetical protein VFN68_12285, partial [Acidimicrobiales bacterium]|nr:hypothetical protein [Acidimicrobiales bacterium]
MLTITINAAEAIRKLASDHNASGLRISSRSGEDRSGAVELAVSLVGSSEPGDQVVAEEGCQVFIQDRLATLLADKALDTVGPA